MVDNLPTICKKLKELRERTGLSVREVSERLRYATPSGYQHYEDRFKGTFLPLQLVNGLKKIFMPYGITESELNALAGVESHNKSRAAINTHLLKECANAIRNEAAVSDITLSDDEFIDLTATLYEIIEDDRQAGIEDISIGTVRHLLKERAK
jgi:transcriptional regulator with XRE-family HTH domain